MLSEWYDSQKRPSRDFRKLPQEGLDKANPRRKELTVVMVNYFRVPSVQLKSFSGQ
jgi:hypothetical protein